MIRFAERATASGHLIGWATLAAPRSLNALTLDMAAALHRQLADWAANPHVVAVVLEGEGRAFCAGGDVRRMREGILAGDDYCDRFFEQEYRTDYAIHCYPKPVLAWGHGVVMGGGLGLLLGASHRVVTPSTRLAMPEVNIGLFPDVAASSWLRTLPAGLGLFLGVTGCEWNAADALALGAADYLLADDGLPAVADCLAALPWSGQAGQDRRTLAAALDALAAPALAPQLLPYSQAIAEACQRPLAMLGEALAGLSLAEDWFLRACENLLAGCPVTQRIVEQQLQRVAGLPLAAIFRQDWNLASQCCRHPDFPEGVRAQLVDKDKAPRWVYRTVDAVPAAYVDAHFESPVSPHPLADLGLPG